MDECVCVCVCACAYLRRFGCDCLHALAALKPSHITSCSLQLTMTNFGDAVTLREMCEAGASSAASQHAVCIHIRSRMKTALVCTLTTYRRTHGQIHMHITLVLASRLNTDLRFVTFAVLQNRCARKCLLVSANQLQPTTPQHHKHTHTHVSIHTQPTSHCIPFTSAPPNRTLARPDA